MKKSFLLAIFLLLFFSSFAQTDTTYWNKGGNIGITFNQSTLSNWAAGGTSSISGGAFFTQFFDYLKGRTKWNNSIELGYGLIKENDLPQRKTDDKIILTSSYGYQLSSSDEKWYLSTLLDFRTQFYEGFDADEPDKLISNFMAPAYLLATVGIEWKPTSYFTMGLGPVSAKWTFVYNDELSARGEYGVEPGENLRSEFGGTFAAAFDKEIFDNVQFKSKLLLFSNYLENPDKIDVNWENTVNMKINDVLSANLFNQLIYDYDVKFDQLDDAGNPIVDPEGNPLQEDRVQFKNILGIGISYKFGGTRG
ncbi:MAG: DUF3078 domain-containing protein [Reichenbachiella sp.]